LFLSPWYIKQTAFYSDRHTVFHVSKRDAKTNRMTQFGRVLHDLNIEQANAWLPDFIADFNHRVAKVAQYPKDMHRPL
jgi:hypothetical protein